MGLRGMVILELVLMGVLGTVSHAQDTKSGNFLLDSCQISLRVAENPDIDSTLSKYEIWRDGLCQGTVEGVAVASPIICLPEGVTVHQEIRVVVKYLQGHPEKLHLRSTSLVESALSEAFPCSK